MDSVPWRRRSSWRCDSAIRSEGGRQWRKGLRGTVRADALIPGTAPADMTNPSYASASHAALASRCERAPQASCSSLPMPQLVGNLPGTSTQRVDPCRRNFGLGIRQPTVVWCSTLLRGSGSSDLGRTYGARLIPLEPAGDDERGVACGNGAPGLDDRHRPGGAGPVDRHPGGR
jgi:hypothetical protein